MSRVMLQTGKPHFLPDRDGLMTGARERRDLLLGLLADTAAHLLVTSDGDALVRGVFERIAPALDLDAYFNFMVNEAGDAMRLASCAGIPEEEAAAIRRLEFGQAVCGTVALLRKPLVATFIQESDDPKVQLVRGYGIRAYACNPLMAGDRLLGTLSFATRSRDKFGEDELEFFRTVAHYVAVTEERLRMTAALQQQAALLDLAQDAIIAIGRDGDVQFWNRGAESLYGWNALEAAGRNFAELLSPEPAQSFDEIRAALASHPAWEAEGARTRRDGRTLHVWSRWAARPGADGLDAGFLILEHDISQRKRMEEQLRQTQKLESLGVLAGGIAHDFNNLLAGILGNASLLEDDIPEGAKPLLHQVIYGAEQAANLTRQLLAYAGKGRSQRSAFDLSSLVRDTTALLRVSVPKTIEIRLDLAPDVPPILADPGQIQQVLMNLVINASEAIDRRADGLIEIRTGTEAVAGSEDGLPAGQYVRVTVSDNGCGMSAQTIANIFDPFFTTKFTGRGLGLSAVLGIMHSSGGRISVDSRPGEGTTFRLLFPAAERAHMAAPEREKIAAPVRATVLVVDDEAHVRTFVKAMLDRAGFKVLMAENGEEALRQLHSAGPVDLVLLDVIMPLMNGAETLAQIRRSYPSVKVLITSGYGADEVSRLCPGAVNGAFIQKPFRPKALLEKVAAALQTGAV